MVGRFQRSDDNPQSLLRQHMHSLLREQQQQPRRGNRHLRQLTQLAEALGIKTHSAVPVFTQTQQKTPQTILDNWANKPGIAGTSPDKNIKHKVLAQLTDWAKNRWTNLDEPLACEQSYVLQAFQLNL